MMKLLCFAALVGFAGLVAPACSLTDLTADELDARARYFEQVNLSLADLPWLYVPADPKTPGEPNLHGLVTEPGVWRAAPNGLLADDRLGTVVTHFWESRGAGGERVLVGGDLLP